MLTLKEWRDKKSFSMRDLAKLSGITSKTIFNIENGIIKTRPTKRTIRLLALALGVEPSDIAL